MTSMAGSTALREAFSSSPVTRPVVGRYVAGEHPEDAIATARVLNAAGLAVSIDRLGEDVHDESGARRAGQGLLELVAAIGGSGFAAQAEVSIKLSALGAALEAHPSGGGARLALEQARAVCAAARNAGTTVTLDMEDHTTTDTTLAALAELRQDFPDTGVAIQSALRRSEDDCRTLAVAGSRVRLCKGAYAEPERVAYLGRREVDLSYVRCARILLAGPGRPMFATHDQRLVDIVGALAARERRAADSYELQMLYGVRPEAQRRLAATGTLMRVYVPYGTDWYPYLVRRMAERPANLMLFLRSLAPEGLSRGSNG